MSYKIDEIEGIGPSYAQKLAQAEVRSTADLLGKCSTPKGRKELAELTGVSEKMILRWTNLADLMRVNGVGPQFSELLEAAGVDTIKELRNRNAPNLAEKMAQVNSEKKLARTTPSVKQVEDWVGAAKKMDPIISY